MSGLKRKTPLKRKISLADSWLKKCAKIGKKWSFTRNGNLRSKKPLKKISKSRRKKLRSYYEVSREWLSRPENAACAICLVRGITPAPATEVHHKFGRAGSLLSDERGFVPSCRSCREWPHENPREARELGILGEAKHWNTPIDDHT